MQKTLFLLILFISGLRSAAQQQYFMYLQSDDHSAFYAKISDKMYSSSENGYMIIPKLDDSNFDLSIGFAKNLYPEQRFPISLNKKDKGFQLKNLGEKGWALVNLQTSAVIQNTAQYAKAEPAFSGTKKTDAFSELLANVVNDSAVLYTPVKAAEPVTQKPAVVARKDDKVITEEVNVVPAPTAKQTVNTANEQKDSMQVAATIPEKPVAGTKDSSSLAVSTPQLSNVEKTSRRADSTVAAKQPVEKPFISRIDERKSGNSYEATYLELYALTTDTIRIFIPSDESAPATVPQIQQKPAEPVVEQKVARQESSPVPNADSASASKKVLLITNSDCKSFATDNDVDKFRIKLIDEKTIDEKLTASRKYFRSKCYSVVQVKALSELFPSDETKYQFFELAYPFVSDTSNFYLLQEMIANDLYRKKFQSLIHQ